MRQICVEDRKNVTPKYIDKKTLKSVSDKLAKCTVGVAQGKKNIKLAKKCENPTTFAKKLTNIVKEKTVNK